MALRSERGDELMSVNCGERKDTFACLLVLRGAVNLLPSGRPERWLGSPVFQRCPITIFRLGARAVFGLLGSGLPPRCFPFSHSRHAVNIFGLSP